MRTWDPDVGGSAFRDDGSLVEIPREALQGSVFRLLRPGQRVKLEVEDGVVVAVALP
jgi:cold shock CspA family protein